MIISIRALNILKGKKAKAKRLRRFKLPENEFQ